MVFRLYGVRYMRRRHLTEEHKRNVSLAKMGEKNAIWKGDSVSYKSLHAWVRRNKPAPTNCSSCNLPKRLDAANISGNYLRDLSDWVYLCRKCHMESDGRMSAWQKANSLKIRVNGRIVSEKVV